MTMKRRISPVFENFRTFETDFAGRPLVIETGKMAGLANGACLVRYGDTVVHVAVTASAKPREGVDFFPLSVDFEEKLYSVGKIPGSFLKREGRPTDKAILTSRVIDRPIRPLFPKDMRNDVSVVCTVMSVDHDCAPEIAGMVGTSIALSISDIPWNGPISGVSVGLVDGEYVNSYLVSEGRIYYLDYGSEAGYIPVDLKSCSRNGQEVQVLAEDLNTLSFSMAGENTIFFASVSEGADTADSGYLFYNWQTGEQKKAAESGTYLGFLGSDGQKAYLEREEQVTTLLPSSWIFRSPFA